jgi:hypothetical protein
MVIIAMTDPAGLPGNISSWQVWHSGSPTATTELNANSAVSGVLYTLFGSTAPTSTVTTVAQTGAGYNTNGGGRTFLMLSWAPISGFSSFGSYTGNGANDGPFVYTGFSPEFILIKNASATGSWKMYSGPLNGYNPINQYFDANATLAQTSLPPGDNNVDMLSNGFKVYSNGASETNSSGATYIYAAFAQNPFGGSNVAPVTAR